MIEYFAFEVITEGADTPPDRDANVSAEQATEGYYVGVSKNLEENEAQHSSLMTLLDRHNTSVCSSATGTVEATNAKQAADKVSAGDWTY